MNSEFSNFLKRKHAQFEDQFDSSDLDSRFIEFFKTNTRLKIQTCGMIITGTVGVTTGWKPCFLLMRTKRSIGSVWTLGKNDRIIGIKPEGQRFYH